MSGEMEAAKRLLSRAVELDRSGRRTEAVICYQESIQLLLDTAKATSDPKLGAACRDKVRECLDRAEKLHEQIQREKRAGKYHEEIPISENQTGCSYQSLFGRLLDDGRVTRVQVEDPYIRAHHQEQEKKLEDIREDLESRNIRLSVTYSDTLHDRQIRLDTGWIIKIGRGLDIYKAPVGARSNKLTLGQFDLDLRPCYETKVDIFHNQDVVRTTKR